MNLNEPVQQGESYPGFSPAAYGVQPPLPSAPATAGPVPHFRPLSTGEVLDRTFALYKQRFWLFVGIGMLPAAMLLVASSIRLIFLTVTHRTTPVQPFPGPLQPGAPPLGEIIGPLLLLSLYTLPIGLLFLVAYGISHAATVDAVNRMGQGMAVSVGDALHAVRGRWLRWCGIVFRQFWSGVWPALPGVVVILVLVGLMTRPSISTNLVLLGLSLVFGWLLGTAGFILGVINFVRHSLAVAAGVSENLGVNAAMQRARLLAAGRKGRLFLAWLLIYALQTVVAAVQLPLLFAAMTLHGGAFIAVQAVVMLVQFAAVALVSPVASIAFTLFYIDERVRREGLDIELLMQRTLPPAVPHLTEI